MKDGANRSLPVLVALALCGPAAAQDNIVVGQGAAQANPNRVRVFDASGAPTATDFMAYAAGQWGVNVASADVDPGGFDEITTGPGPGPIFGPQVRMFDRDGVAIPQVNFYAYGTLRGGVNVANGDIDGADEMLTGAGPSAVFGPHVRGWHYDGNTTLSALAKVNFFAYGTLRYGVNVGVGGIDTDGFDEILTAPGPGGTFTCQIRGWDYDGAAIAAMSKVNFNANGTTSGGGKVAGGDADDDSMDDILAASGGQVSGYEYDGVAVAALPAYVQSGYGHGGGDIGGAGGDDLLIGDLVSSDVRVYDYDGAAMSQILSFSAFGTGSMQVTLAGGDLGL